MERRCAVIGAGSFGTSLAVHLAGLGHRVRLWDRHPERVATMNADRHNPRYLPTVSFPAGLSATASLAEAVEEAQLVVAAVPSHAMRQVMTAAAPHLPADADVCCASKGITSDTLQTMHALLVEVLGEAFEPAITVLSGPTFAKELAQGLPSTIVAAGPDASARRVADTFHGGALRVYHTHDLIGVCLGGSLKNVIAIGCGISDGLGMGLNARAGLITRGLAEITRLARHLGADPLTMMGLAGMGDLVLTCTGNLSRNRRVGLALGEGRTLDDILEELGEVAEGVVTARSAHALAERHGVELPITEQVYRILHEDKPARQGFLDLMDRERKAERG